MPNHFGRPLLAWYARHKRALPWRGAADPYHVWVAEIMLQQTQVETVIPYYRRWLARFPTVQALAAAPQQEVLALWEGLGYYSRARNLHRAAQIVANELGGALPATVDGLRALPGIGRYTAGAIASIAMGADAAVLDGNVKRVLARAFDFVEDVKSPAGVKKLWALAESLVPHGHAGDYNQALMDLGATICTPRAPQCPMCPLRRQCAAFRLGVQLERPVAGPRRARPERIYAAGVVRKRGRVLIVQREAGELLGGLWAFPATQCGPQADLAECLAGGLRQEVGLEAAVGEQTQTLHHGFTHFTLSLHVFECRWRAGRLRPGGAPSKWVRVEELGGFPMGKTDRQIAEWVQGEATKKTPALICDQDRRMSKS
jgi:A/G-specific adenine glycosylase